MTLNAGQAPAAASIVNLQPVIYSAQQSNTGQQTVTTTETDSVGCTVTFTTLTAAKYIAYIAADHECSATGTTLVSTRLNVDGTTVTTPSANSNANATTRQTVGQVITGTLSGAGSHTVKLRLFKSLNSATIVAYDVHTRFILVIQEVV